MKDTFEKIYISFFNQKILTDEDTNDWDLIDGKITYAKKSITLKKYFDLTDLSIILYSYLLNHLTDKNAKNFLNHFSYAKIAKKLGIEKNAVYENMKRLKKAGLVYFTKENNNKISNIDLTCIIPCNNNSYYEYEIKTSEDVAKYFGVHGFIICPSRILENKEITATEKINYSSINSYNNLKRKNSSFKSSMAGFANFINRCRTSVIRVLKNLQEKGLIFLDTIKQGAFVNWHSNFFVLALD